VNYPLQDHSNTQFFVFVVPFPVFFLSTAATVFRVAIAFTAVKIINGEIGPLA